MPVCTKLAGIIRRFL